MSSKSKKIGFMVLALWANLAKNLIKPALN